MQTSIPHISYPEDLPITAEIENIAEAFTTHQVVVIAGETGSGKTTQIPKICLAALYRQSTQIKGRIGCTQPRRLAATSVATRVAEELAPHQHLVGYTIRFHDRTPRSAKIKFMTDGILLAETRNDPLLRQYNTLIIDEAHERSLNIDFLLGYLKQLIVKRPELKLIITSATIDTKAFSQHFHTSSGDAPIIEVSGRSYPVDLRYRPILQSDNADNKEEQQGSIEHVAQVTDEIFKTRPQGDILIFLPTERDIRECCSLLEKRYGNSVVLPLFGRLASADQARIFGKTAGIKIIVATNVAETSITVPGIRYVIDSGLARISQYNVRAKTTSLPIAKISQASANQRKGRAGRIAPGICYRLYSEEEYNERDEFGVPEIKRSNLAEVILQMTSLRLGDPTQFPFIDPPHTTAIREGYALLRELGAITNKNRLSKIGHIMAQLPVDPCISRILLEASSYKSLSEVTIIASILAIQDPRIRPAESENKADEAHKVFLHPHSDFMTLLNIWNTCFGEGDFSWSKLKKFCKKNYLSFQRMREWYDLHQQLVRILTKHKEHFVFNEQEANYEQIHRPFLTGFLRNIARKKQETTQNSTNHSDRKAPNTIRKKIRIFQGSQNRELMIFPGSSLFNKPPEWILAASFMETSRLYALTVAAIEPEWIERAAGRLCKYNWIEPTWQKRKGFVQAIETLSLFGLPIVTASANRRVNFARRDKKNIPEARQIFISQALIAGEVHGKYSFLRHNLDLIAKWQESEAKLRTRNLVADVQTLFAFYDKRLPQQVYEQKQLNRFLKRSPKALFMSEQDILLRDFTENELINFPPIRTIAGLDITLEYHFEPGSEQDGVTFRLPLDFAINASQHHFDWLVPGLLQEKVIYLLKSLVKNIRKRLVPVHNTADAVLDDIEFGAGSLFTAMERSILKQFRVHISHHDWSDDLPLHLQPRFLIFDDYDNELASGRNLAELVQQTRHLTLSSPSQSSNSIKSRSKAEKVDSDIIKKWENSEHSTWDFDDLPPEIPSYTAGGAISGFLYPVLQPVPQKGCIIINFEKEREKAATINYSGVLYLFSLQFREQYKSLKRLISTSLTGPSTLFLSALGTKSERNSAVLTQIVHCLYGDFRGHLPEKESFFQKYEHSKKEGFFQKGQHYFTLFTSALRKRREVMEQTQTLFQRAASKGHKLPQMQGVFTKEINEIFPAELPLSHQLIDYSQVRRELDYLSIRLERFYVNPAKDAQKAGQIQPFSERFAKFNAEIEHDLLSDETKKELKRYKEMLMEFKISIFAPEIKKKIPISAKKLDTQWSKIAG